MLFLVGNVGEPIGYGSQNRRKNRQRNIIWFNPPYSMNVQTNIGREFLNLVSKHFPKKHRYNKIFKKNTVKVSYSCTDNLQTIIKKHNRKILETNTNTTISTEKNCNCRKKKDCPLKNNCLTSSVIYNANVTTESDAAGMNYIGLTEGTFKLLNNATPNTNFLFGTETIQTARNYQNTSGRSRTATQTTKLTGVF